MVVPRTRSRSQTGVVAWLDVPVDELVARLGVPGEAGARPLLAGASDDAARAEKVAALLAERSRLYEQASDVFCFYHACPVGKFMIIVGSR